MNVALRRRRLVHRENILPGAANGRIPSADDCVLVGAGSRINKKYKLEHHTDAKRSTLGAFDIRGTYW